MQHNSVPVFFAKNTYQYHLTEIFHRNFRKNGKRSNISRRGKLICTRNNKLKDYDNCSKMTSSCNSPFSSIKIPTRLRGVLVIFLYLVWFSLCLGFYWELKDKEVEKKNAILSLKPLSQVRILIYRRWAICYCPLHRKRNKTHANAKYQSLSDITVSAETS